MGAKHSAKQHSRGWSAQARRAKAISLRAQGMTEPMIARRVGVCHQTVSKWLRDETDRLNQILEVGRQHLIREQLAALQEAQRLAFSGFKKSLRDAVEQTITETPDGTTTSTKRRGQSGNPSYLAQVVATANRLAQMMGLDAVQKEEPPQDVEPIMEVVVDTTDQAAQLRDVHQVTVKIENVHERFTTDPEMETGQQLSGPTAKTDQKAKAVRRTRNPRKGVRGRPRGRKNGGRKPLDPEA